MTSSVCQAFLHTLKLLNAPPTDAALPPTGPALQARQAGGSPAQCSSRRTQACGAGPGEHPAPLHPSFIVYLIERRRGGDKGVGHGERGTDMEDKSV